MQHVDVVRGLIASFNAPDFDPEKTVRKFFTEDSVVRFVDSMPPMSGLAKLGTTWKSFRVNGEKVKTKMISVYEAGPVVVAHRTDTVNTPGKPDQSFEVVGVFAVKDGKIKEWIDYMITPLGAA
jgi:limonene-1,2-epoxide hydrolase